MGRPNCTKTDCFSYTNGPGAGLGFAREPEAHLIRLAVPHHLPSSSRNVAAMPQAHSAPPVRQARAPVENDAGAAIQIGAEHFQDVCCREALLVPANRDPALELHHALNKLCRGTRMQPKLANNFYFSHEDIARALGTGRTAPRFDPKRRQAVRRSSRQRSPCSPQRGENRYP